VATRVSRPIFANIGETFPVRTDQVTTRGVESWRLNGPRTTSKQMKGPSFNRDFWLKQQRRSTSRLAVGTSFESAHWGEFSCARVFALLLLTSLLLFDAPATAQVQSRPSDPPIVTADNDSLVHQPRTNSVSAGTCTTPAGAAVFFNSNTMVRFRGHYNGVPLYNRHNDRTVQHRLCADGTRHHAAVRERSPAGKCGRNDGEPDAFVFQ
jgi:hypothetical protein